jgi:hypothetical protein
MQYLLTEEEYRALVDARDARTEKEQEEYRALFEKRNEQYRALVDTSDARTEKGQEERRTQALQDFCVLASQYIPVATDGNEPWKCNLEAVKSDDMTCDGCPAREVCPSQFKHCGANNFSKESVL